MLSLMWIVLGLTMVLVAVWLGWTRWSAILSGHPVMLVAAIACGLLGMIALAWSVATLLIGRRLDEQRDPEHPESPARRTPAQVERRARWRIVLAVPALLGCLLLVSSLAYARPFVAEPGSIAAMRSSSTVRLVERLGWYEMVPIRANDAGEAVKPTTGLVFVPGARVDSRAYGQLLRPLAEAGYLVAVLKEPFGLAIIDQHHASSVMDVHPEIAYWAVGGHSLGGVAASSVADADARVNALVLYAGYPARALSRRDLKVTSISGTQDRLATPAEIEASRSDLPPDATFVIVDGGVHSYFGDYGEQPGDGTPGVDRGIAQAEIVKATQERLASLAPPPPPKKK